MGCKESCSFSACGCISVAVSIVFAVIAGVMFSFGNIPNIVTAVWISFGLAVLFLILLVAGCFIAANKKSSLLAPCACSSGGCLLAGIIGTIVTALTALSITLNIEAISIIVLISLGAFFTALMIIAATVFIICIINELCN